MIHRMLCLLVCVAGAYAQGLAFRDVAPEQGLVFRHHHGGTGEKYYVETMGAGCCLLDYDNDGDLDVYFPQGSPLPGWNRSLVLENKLFRNDRGTWTDVTSEADVGHRGYGIGCASADVDNDGYADLYVTNFGPDVLYHNNGDGTFSDITVTAGIENTHWGSSAAFFDADNDGWLDLYVVNYVAYSLDRNPWCGEHRSGRRAYCDPDVFAGVADRLYHNNGDGTFQDVSAAAGIATERGKGLGVVPGDIDNDGDLDLYVANDKVMNLLWINDGQGRFTEDALFAGVGFNENGYAEAGMGVDFGDYDRDGWLDLFVTNFSGESNTLYHNQKNGFFLDVTFSAGLGGPSLNFLGFGTKFVDLDRDGWLDIFVVNGHVIDNISLFNPGYTHAQPKQVFLNLRNGTFDDVTDQIRGALQTPTVGRGAAFGDIDNDGDVDVVISNNNGPANLLQLEDLPQNNWVGFQLEGRTVNRDAIGAKITLTSPTGSQVAWVNPGASYLASNDPRVLFGLGADSIVDEVIVAWPGGGTDRLSGLQANRYYRITQGGQVSQLPY